MSATHDMKFKVISTKVTKFALSMLIVISFIDAWNQK